MPFRPAHLDPHAVQVVPVRPEGIARVVNSYVVGDHAECVVIDPAGELDQVRQHLGERRVVAILCTQGHRHHTGAAWDLHAATEAPIFVAPGELPDWQAAHGTGLEHRPHVLVIDGLTVRAGAIDLQAIVVPGHTPGGTAWVSPQLAAVFTGDALGITGPAHGARPPGDIDALVSAIRTRVFTLPGDTVVYPGHGGPIRVASSRWDPEFWR